MAILYEGHQLARNFEYVCRGERLNEFSTFANVLMNNGNTVLLERAMSYGKADFAKVILTKQQFEKYYRKIER